MAVSEVRTQGKYLVIYDKGDAKTPSYGSVNLVQAGDIVSIYLDGYQTLEVEKIVGSKWTKKIKTKAIKYHEHLVTQSIDIDPRTIVKILRLKPGEHREKTMEEKEKE